MTRGRHTSQAYLYQKVSHEADHEHATLVISPEIHQLRRGDNYSAARAFRAVLANDDRPTTMLNAAERITTAQVPEVIAQALERNEHRRRNRQSVWREHLRVVEAWHAGYERVAVAERTRGAGIVLESGGLEL